MRKGTIILFMAIILFGSSIDPGGVFLMIFPGSRATALGGAFAGVEGDVFGTYYNTASLGFANKKLIGLQHANWLTGLWPDMYYEYLAYVHPLKEDLVITGAFTYITTGETEATVGGEVIARFRNYDFAIKVAVANRLNDRMAVSLGIKYIYSFLAPEWLVREVLGARGGGQGKAWAVDGGFFYKILPNLNLGVAIQNIGTPLQYLDAGEKDDLPRTLRIGLSSVPFENDIHRVMLNADITKILVGVTSNLRDEFEDTWKSFGIEYSIFNIFSLRAGYFIDILGHRVGLTWGIGVHYKTFRFDVSSDQKIYEFETSNYRLSAQYAF